MQQAVAGGVTIALLHLPLEQIQPKAREAASPAICASDVGRIARIHRALIETEDWITNGNRRVLAAANGISDAQAFVPCMGSEIATSRVAANSSLANRLGITDTPAFVTRAGIEMGVEGAAGIASRVDMIGRQQPYEMDRVLFESTTFPHPGVSTISKVSGGLLLSDNRIVLGDAMARSLFFVDLQSGGVEVVGRRGQGPGEFRTLRSVGRTASGGVFADDPSGARVTVFGADGSLVETISYNPMEFRGFLWIPQPIGVYADGAVVFRDSDPMQQVAERPDGPYRENIEYLALNPDGERARITQADGQERVWLNCIPTGRSTFSYTYFEKPFAYSAIEAVVDDLLIVGDTESGTLWAYDRTGGIAAEYRYGRGGEITSEHDRRWREQRLVGLRQQREQPVDLPDGAPPGLAGLVGQRMCGEGDDGLRFYRTAEANTIAPAFSRMIGDGEGRLWVQRYGLPGDTVAQWSRWRLSEGGDRMATVVFPREYELLDARDDKVLLRATDDYDVERAVVATLARPR